jgi:hypothetical protein
LKIAAGRKTKNADESHRIGTNAEQSRKRPKEEEEEDSVTITFLN